MNLIQGGLGPQAPAESRGRASGLASPLEVLSQVFGFPDFRGLQADAVQHVVDGGDALVLMPTGAGKSICYQVPALCRHGTAVVVSPLIALMDDQVAALRQSGVSAGALHSELTPQENTRVWRALNDGTLDLLYVSPERLLSPGTQECLARLAIALVAVDEAHCVSAWGHEFRPEYRALARLGSLFAGVPRMALTATADARTRDDVLAALDMQGARVFAASFHRDNLHIAALAKAGETQQLTDFLARHAGETGIIYCGSRVKTERTAASLVGRGLPAVPFHAGLPPEHKRALLARFRSGEPVIVCATIAFGMGIDKPDVRFVAHLDMPDSPESYYQQIGRAGRDGERSDTLLLYGGEDIARARHWLAQSSAPEAEQTVKRSRLEAMIALCETVECRTRALLGCFGEALEQPCGHCDCCLSPVATFDGTLAARQALSAVYRTGQRFGAMHVVGVLRGVASEMSTRCGHDKLAVFGLGRDHSVEFWRGVFRQLIARGALATSSGEYATLALVEEVARPILRGEVSVALREEPTGARAARNSERRERRAAAALPSDAPSGAAALLGALKGWRSAEAKTQGVPPYVIFHDSVLHEITLVRPASLAALGEIKGVGASKLVRYGAALLELLR